MVQIGLEESRLNVCGWGGTQLKRTLASIVVLAVMAVDSSAQDGSRVRTASIRGMELPYEVVGGLAVYAGDIILGTAEDVIGGTAGARNAVPTGYRSSGLFCTWPNGVIPYVIDDNVPRRVRDLILQGIRTWDTQTVLRFVRREVGHEHYLRFMLGPASGVSICQEGGPGEQRIVVDRNTTWPLLHKLGHAIGLERENQRRDRDRWLTVIHDNIAGTPLAQSAWHPLLKSGPDIGVYDYRSIMHYGFIEPQKQRNHARPYQAETIPPGMPFGATMPFAATLELSPGDSDSVARLYGHIPSEYVVSTNPAGLEVIVDGERITAPASFAWATGSEHTLEVPSPQFRPGSRFLFGRWSDDGGRVHRITAHSDTTLYQASFIAQHQVSTGAEVWCRDATAACEDAESIDVTVSPASPDGYYTLRTPIEVAATARHGSSVRLLRWDVQYDYFWGGFLSFLHGAASNPASTFAMPGLSYVAQFGNGPILQVDSNVDPVPISIGDWCSLSRKRSREREPSGWSSMIPRGGPTDIASGAGAMAGTRRTRSRYHRTPTPR